MIRAAYIGQTRARARLSAGFTLIEVLIALVVLAVGMLGLSALFIDSLKLNRNAVHRNAAITLAADMAERLRAGSPGPAAENNRIAWEAEASKQLPEGSTTNIRTVQLPADALVSGSALKRYDIELEWPETGQKTAGRYALTVYVPAE